MKTAFAISFMILVFVTGVQAQENQQVDLVDFKGMYEITSCSVGQEQRMTSYVTIYLMSEYFHSKLEHDGLHLDAKFKTLMLNEFYTRETNQGEQVSIDKQKSGSSYISGSQFTGRWNAKEVPSLTNRNGNIESSLVQIELDANKTTARLIASRCELKSALASSKCVPRIQVDCLMKKMSQ